MFTCPMHPETRLPAPGVCPPALRQMDGSAPVDFEAAAVIAVLAPPGQILELRAPGADLGRDSRFNERGSEVGAACS